MTVGDRIKIAREAAQMTQDQLGQLCGTTKQTIFKYENNVVTNIPLDRLERIADVLDVSPSFLMGWSDSDGKKPAAQTDSELLDAELIRRLCELTPEELQIVDAVVQGLIAKR